MKEEEMVKVAELQEAVEVIDKVFGIRPHAEREEALRAAQQALEQVRRKSARHRQT
jgi:GTP cyclohydrolase III